MLPATILLPPESTHLNPCKFHSRSRLFGQVGGVVLNIRLASNLGFERDHEFLARQPHLYVAINLSASDFHSARLIENINEKIRRYAVKAEQIKIEVTERGFIDVAKTTPVIQHFDICPVCSFSCGAP